MVGFIDFQSGRDALDALRRYAEANLTLLDSTHTRDHRFCVRPAVTAAILISVVVALAGASARSARADGDPASDVLVYQPLFLPQDANVPATQQAQLTALLAAARRSGYPIRVALIAGASDLGAVTALWRAPQNYARFLGQELALNDSGPLLVVMPGGYGFYRPGGPRPGEQSAVTALPAPGGSLAAGALTAIQRLAAASGHNLPTPRATGWTNHGSADAVAWIVFAVGAILILLAWTASLRARPPRALDRKASVS